MRLQRSQEAAQVTTCGALGLKVSVKQGQTGLDGLRAPCEGK